MMHPEHRIESCGTAWAHVAREIGIMYSVVEIFQSAHLGSAIASLRTGNLSKRLILR